MAHPLIRPRLYEKSLRLLLGFRFRSLLRRRWCFLLHLHFLRLEFLFRLPLGDFFLAMLPPYIKDYSEYHPCKAVDDPHKAAAKIIPEAAWEVGERQRLKLRQVGGEVVNHRLPVPRPAAGAR